MRVPKTVALVSLSFRVAAALCLLLVAAPAAHAQDAPQPPTMKKPDKVVVPPSRTRRRFDRAHNATYVNVDIALLFLTETKQKDGPATLSGRALTLTFQLAYRGDATDDLVAAYLIVESTAAPSEAAKLQAVRRVEVLADPYEYAYERTNYATEMVAPGGAGQSGPPLKRESAVFKILPEDLPQLTGAGRLELKLGPEAFTVKSQQLTELRRTLAAGVRR